MKTFNWVALATDAGVPTKYPKLVFIEDDMIFATHGRVMHIALSCGLPEGAYDPKTGELVLTHEKLKYGWKHVVYKYFCYDKLFDVDLKKLTSSKTFMCLKKREVEVYDGLCPGFGMGLSVTDVKNALKGGKVKRAFQVGPTEPLVIQFETDGKLAFIMPFTKGISSHQ